MLPAGDQSSAPEDGRNYLPKHVELIETINKIIIVASSWLFKLLDILSFWRGLNLRGIFDINLLLQING